ncbi:MAG: diacylglycerol kinase family lipid kinase [Bacteroidia bacterium]|nr:diacylglycerol kinase family lipid kinase [Bacteroidia bacterium]
MTETPFALLVNPVAGNGKGRFHFLKIKQELERRSVLFGEFITAKAGDEHSLLTNAIKNGFRNFIIIGGDGTLSKTIHSFLQSSENNNEKFRFGVIPSGTGNDWCRHHAIPFQPLKALEIILKGKTIHHDAGIVRSGDGTRYFINMAGTGFQGYVVMRIAESDCFKTNRLFYYLKVLQYIFSYKSSIVNIECEEMQINGPVFSVAAGVCRYNGGGMMQAPGAVADDGLLDITIIKKMPLIQLLLNFPKISSGKHVNHPQVSVVRTKNLFIRSPETIYADADGELSFASPFQFTIWSKAVQMFVP